MAAGLRLGIMNIANYYGQTWGRVLLGVTILVVILCVGIMVHNLYKTAGGAEVSAGIDELKPMPQPFSRSTYEELIKGFKDPYTAVDVHKRNIFSQPADIIGQYKICHECGAKIPIDAKICPKCGAVQLETDTDGDGMPDKWEEKYGLNPRDPTDAGLDKDNDGFTNLQEYLAGTDPTDPNSNPRFQDIKERMRVQKIYKKPVKLLFKGYIQLGDGTYVATINWAGKTDFKKPGDEIRGYKVVDFKKNVSEKTTLWGGTEKIDQSIITLERDTGERFNLEIGKITLEKEIYAEIWDRKETRSYDVYIGADLLGNKILDISPSQVIIGTQNGGKVYLEKES